MYALSSRNGLRVQMRNEDPPVTAEEIRTAIAYLSGGLGDGLRLIRVTCSSKSPGENRHPSIRLALELSEVGSRIHWLAILDTQTAETFLFMSLYAQKFAKLIRKWNKTDSRIAFDIDINPINVSDAFIFYQSATSRGGPSLDAS